MKQGACTAEKGWVAVLPGSPNPLISNEIPPEISSETCQTCGLGGACVKGLVRGASDRNPTSLPEFDAHGWCHDMSKAPRDGSRFLAFEADRESRIYECWWQNDFVHWEGWQDDWDNEPNPTAWRPLPLPPVKE